MEIRNAVHPEHAALFDTEELREHFLIQNLFNPDQFKLIYSYFDRLIVGSVCPVNPVAIDIDEKIIGAPHLLARRELGLRELKSWYFQVPIKIIRQSII